MIVKDWMTAAAKEIAEHCFCGAEQTRAIIAEHCPLKDNVAYIPVRDDIEARMTKAEAECATLRQEREKWQALALGCSEAHTTLRARLTLTEQERQDYREINDAVELGLNSADVRQLLNIIDRLTASTETEPG